jgi:hypothetical protein
VKAARLIALIVVAVAIAIEAVSAFRAAAESTAADTGTDCARGAPPPSESTSTSRSPTLLAMIGRDSATPHATLAEVDPQTLAPRRRVRADRFWGAWAFSPDGRRLALTSVDGRVRLIDLPRMRKLRHIRVDAQALVALVWPTEDRLVALEQTGTEVLRHARLLVIDARHGKVLARRDLDRAVDAVTEANGRIVAVLSNTVGIGPARLVVVEPNGELRCVALSETTTGTRKSEEGRLDVRQPGLVLDASGDRAFVVSAGEPIAEVNLGDLDVSYDSLEAPISLLGRLRNWLEPEAHAKGPMTGSRRHALWLGNGLLAVSGSDWDSGSGHSYSESPAGLDIIDTSSWSARTLDERVSRILLADDTLLGVGGYGHERSGVSVYDLDGNLRFRLFEGASVWDLQAAGSYAYVLIERLLSVVNLRSGEVIASGLPEPGELLVGERRPPF